MATEHWAAPPDVVGMLDVILEKYHPALQEAVFAVEFVDSKPFVKDRLNLGKSLRFSKAARVWHPKDKKYDFCISLCADVWHGLLTTQHQRDALLDLRLLQFQVEYEPQVVDVNGKKEKVKDEWGRVTYTDVIKRDDEGRPVWKVEPPDIRVITENIRRFGFWYEDLATLQNVAAKSVEA